MKDLKSKRYEGLVRDLYRFVKEAGEGGVRSDALIQHFDHRLVDQQEQIMFKIVLQKMCRLRTRSESQSSAASRDAKCWVLKDKYRVL